MNKWYPGSNITKGRQKQLTHYTQFSDPFEMGNGITILQHTIEPTKWQERQGKKLVTQGLASLSHIQPRGVAEMQVYAAQLEQKHICYV